MCAPADLFTPLDIYTATCSATENIKPHVEAKLARLAVLVRAAREHNQGTLAMYAGIHIDQHMPLARSELWASGAFTAHDVYAAALQPETQPAASQAFIHDYITDNAHDIFNNTPDTPAIIQVLSKSVAVIPYRSNGLIKLIGSSPETRAFVTQCATASLLGNYAHTRFAAGTAPCTLQERMAAADRAPGIAVSKHAEAVLAEYIAAMVSYYPLLSSAGHTYVHFQYRAFHAADTDIRGCAPVVGFMPPIIVPQFAAPDRVPALYPLAMPTGRCPLVICITCRAISGYLVTPVRGIRPVKMPVSIFVKPGTPRPGSRCRTCNTKFAHTDMHHTVLCLTARHAIIACPGCNNVHAIEGAIKDTRCPPCITAATHTAQVTAAKAAVCSVCSAKFSDRRKEFIQYEIDIDTAVVSSRSVCYLHYSGFNNRIVPYSDLN